MNQPEPPAGAQPIPPEGMVIGLLADPDLPARLAQNLSEVLAGELKSRVSDRVKWKVEVRYDPFEAMYPDYDYLMDKAREHVRDRAWDVLLCLTDLPLRAVGGVIVANINAKQRVALISLPALGGMWLQHRLGDLAVAVVGALYARRVHQGTSTVWELAARLPSRTTRIATGAGEADVEITRTRLSGIPRLLAGMVRANRPWQLVIGLSSALAGALAGTAFGVLYSSIWQLATSLGALRLAAITFAAVAALTVWIITGHSLWERAEPDPVVRDPDLALRNAGTVATVTVGTVVFFLALFVITLAAVALVVPPGYMAKTLGHPVDVRDYLTIALMASVLGIIAGAVGSGLENDITVRKATYGYRERERRRRVEQQRTSRGQ